MEKAGGKIMAWPITQQSIFKLKIMECSYYMMPDARRIQTNKADVPFQR